MDTQAHRYIGSKAVTLIATRLATALDAGIHIRHPTEGYGAFFEDMLLDDSYFA